MLRVLRPLRRAFTSLRNRLTLLIFFVTLLAIGTLYVDVAPGLHTRLIQSRYSDLSADARRARHSIDAAGNDSARIAARVNAAALSSSARVSLLAVRTARGSDGLATIADSSSPGAAPTLLYPVALEAARTGRLRTGLESTRSGQFVEAALPLRRNGEVTRVLAFSSPTDVLEHSNEAVRHQILIAGGIALLLALIGGYLTASWLSRRVRRLERAAEGIAAGDFGQEIRVDSQDELGQLAHTFNEMQRQLSQLDNARKRFIATASHELRTPIFSLSGFLELLEDEDLDEETRRRFLGHVADQVERLRKLSVDLLELSRMDSGSLELRPEPVDVAELISEVAAEFELAIAEHDTNLELRVPTSGEANCDPVRLAQIIRILIDNALTHTPEGTDIVIQAAHEYGSVRITVADDGDGIDPGAMSRIFEPFFTADDAQGSGLGLAIARELAERMDGRLTVVSRPRSTVFELELPA
jgi:signal transduction histidine kinase